MRSLGDAAGGEEIRHDERCASREPVEDSPVIGASASQDELIVQPDLGSARGKLAGVVEDEAVDPVVGVLVGWVESLMDDQRLVEPIRLDDGESERLVFLESVGALHPVQDILALGLRAIFVDAGAAQGQLVSSELTADGVDRSIHLDARTLVRGA
jgi:hypothetical protein